MHTFKLILTKEQSTLSLEKDGQVQGERIWPEARDMGQRLFQAMVELLKERNLRPEEVGDFIVESELPDVYTSSRIAETVKKVYAFGVRRK